MHVLLSAFPDVQLMCNVFWWIKQGPRSGVPRISFRYSLITSASESSCNRLCRRVQAHAITPEWSARLLNATRVEVKHYNDQVHNVVIDAQALSPKKNEA